MYPPAERTIRGSGHVQHYGRHGLGHDALLAAPLFNPTPDEITNHCVNFLDRICTFGYAVTLLDFGKFTAYMFGGDMHLERLRKKRLRFHGGAYEGASWPRVRQSQLEDLRTYEQSTWRRFTMRREDVRNGEAAPYDFTFVVGCYAAENEALATEQMLQQTDFGYPCAAQPVHGVVITERKYNTGPTAARHRTPRRGQVYCVYMLVRVAPASNLWNANDAMG
jgi:hypothetical protein